MLLQELMEMARPKKICPDCNKSMSGNHYWYKGGWRCKKSNRTDSSDEKPTAKRAASTVPKKMTRDEKREDKAREKFMTFQKKLFKGISDKDLKKAMDEYDKGRAEIKAGKQNDDK